MPDRDVYERALAEIRRCQERIARLMAFVATYDELDQGADTASVSESATTRTQGVMAVAGPEPAARTPTASEPRAESLTEVEPTADATAMPEPEVTDGGEAEPAAEGDDVPEAEETGEPAFTPR